MLQRLEALIGCNVGASDGQVGTVKDALFDTQKWAVRHLVVDTGTWLSGHQVLISPIAVRAVHTVDRTVDVNLTKQEIEGAPSIASDQPVSRQYETSLYDHYRWPSYWNGPMLWGYWAHPPW
jgi:sporulation protein YlmC with PRC-barrel domain